VHAIRNGLQVHDEPGHAAGNTYWILDLLDSARRDGLGALLTGQGGNATVSWTGADRGQAIKRLMKTGHWRKTLQLLVYPHVPLPFLRAARRLLRHGQLDWSRTAIRDDFARRIGLATLYLQGSGSTSNPEEWHTPLQQRIVPGLHLFREQRGARHGDPRPDIRQARDGVHDFHPRP